MHHEPTMTIAGDAAATTASFDVVNPATGSVFATAPDCTRDQRRERPGRIPVLHRRASPLPGEVTNNL
jgi:hypothetical protein